MTRWGHCGNFVRRKTAWHDVEADQRRPEPDPHGSVVGAARTLILVIATINMAPKRRRQEQ